MPVERFSPGDACGGEYRCDMQRDPTGDFVDYSDYERLEQENSELRLALNRLEDVR